MCVFVWPFIDSAPGHDRNLTPVSLERRWPKGALPEKNFYRKVTSGGIIEEKSYAINAFWNFEFFWNWIFFQNWIFLLSKLKYPLIYWLTFQLWGHYTYDIRVALRLNLRPYPMSIRLTPSIIWTSKIH